MIGIKQRDITLQAGSENFYSSKWRVTLLQGSWMTLGCLLGHVQVCSVSECVLLGAGLVQPTSFHSSPKKEIYTIINCTGKVISTLFGLSQAKGLASYHHFIPQLWQSPSRKMMLALLVMSRNVPGLFIGGQDWQNILPHNKCTSCFISHKALSYHL